MCTKVATVSSPPSWIRYLTVLVEMIKFEGTKKGQEIAAQMLDVTIRVRDVRPFAVKQMVSISVHLRGKLYCDS